MSPTSFPFPTRGRRKIEFSIGIALCAGLVVASGCRSRAHNDLYQQRMASEIRVLEDQLYDADYQNRVLRDKVERLQQRETTAESSPQREASSRPAPSPDRELEVPPDLDLDMGETFEAPFVEEGIPADPSQLPGLDRPDADATPSPLDAEGSNSATELIPPTAPEPPGKRDLESSDVIPGELVPPPQGEEAEKPPGQVDLPDSIQASNPPVPDAIRIHPGLSGGHQFDGEDQVDGMFLVINAVDKMGKIVDLKQFDIDADLSVVVLDPTREPAAAKLGRWDFTAQEVRGLIGSDPTSGLHVPIRWLETQPTSDEVIVHVRLRADEDEMRCEETLTVAAAAAMARWTPRGD